MPHRTQKGWLKQEKRKEGNTWMLFFRAVRKADGKRVENKIRIGLVKDFPGKDCARAEAERLQLHINPVDRRGAVTFSDLAHHYIEHELSECPESIKGRAHTALGGYKRVIRNRLLPQWAAGLR